MSSSLLKIHYDFSNELSQKEFFLGNLSQQFRSYYIGKGNPTAQYYQNWYTNQDISTENTLFVDPDISSYQAQQTYFSDNDNELLKGYYIAQNAQSLSVFSYFSTPMFELNLDYSSLATDNPLIGHILEAKILEALEVDFIDESEVLTPADNQNHIYKNDFSVEVQAGAGVVADSIPSNEYQETLNKAKGMFTALACLEAPHS